MSFNNYKTLLSRTILLALPALGATAHAQTDYSTAEIIPHEVRGSVYYLQGAGGNIGLSVGDDGIVMIAYQFAQLTDRILAAINEINDGEIRFLINPHMHGDHTGGNENLGRMGIEILARDEVRTRMREMAPDIALPVLTYSEDITIHLNGEEVMAISVPPAHTDGDSYIYFTASDVLHMGDVFRTTGFPYIDTANGGTLQGKEHTDAAFRNPLMASRLSRRGRPKGFFRASRTADRKSSAPHMAGWRKDETHP